MEQLISYIGIIVVTILYIGCLYLLSKADSPDEMLKKAKERAEKEEASKFIA